MTFEPPERFNIADFFLDARIREGRGDRVALVTDQRTWSYRDVQDLANRFGNLLREAGVMPEQRVIIALPDGPEFVAALFGILKIGAVVVMVNPELKPEAISYFYQYTRARVAIVHTDGQAAFEAARADAPLLAELLVVGARRPPSGGSRPSPPNCETFPSHRDDACIWLFSGGTTGQPKAVLQSHWSFAHTTSCYGQGVLGSPRTTSRFPSPSSSSATRWAPTSSSPSRSAPGRCSSPSAAPPRRSSSRSGGTGPPCWSTCPRW